MDTAGSGSLFTACVLLFGINFIHCLAFNSFSSPLSLNHFCTNFSWLFCLQVLFCTSAMPSALCCHHTLLHILNFLLHTFSLTSYLPPFGLSSLDTFCTWAALDHFLLHLYCLHTGFTWVLGSPPTPPTLFVLCRLNYTFATGLLLPVHWTTALFTTEPFGTFTTSFTTVA